MARVRIPTTLSLATLATLMAYAGSACSRPPTRSFIVKMDSKDARPEPSTHEGDANSGDTNTDDGNDTDTTTDSGSGGDTDNGSGTTTPETKTPETTTPDTKTPDTTVPDPKIPDTKPPETEEPMKLTECPNKLSVGRIHQWHATSEGVMIPQQGLIVVKEGSQNVAKVEFVGEGWHVLPVWLKNAYEAEVDLSKSKNFVITYSATADMYVQLRPAFAWSGGDKWAAKIPSTGGASKTLTVSFEDAAAWTAPLGQPPHSLNEARAKARGFVFIGNKPTKFAVTSLLIDGYVPPCD